MLSTGCSRTAAAEFTFFLAIPVMLGWGAVKAAKFVLAGVAMTTTEVAVLVTGVVSAFVMSIISIKFLMGYIKKNDFTAFGIYRIIVGACSSCLLRIRELWACFQSRNAILC